MDWHYTPFALPPLALAAVLVVVAAFVLRRQLDYEPVPGGYVAVAFTLTVAYVLAAAAAVVSSAGREAAIHSMAFKYVGAVALPVVFFLFVLRYTGRGGWLTRRRELLAALVPTAMGALTFTNDRHGLVWKGIAVVDGRGGTAALPEYGPALVGYAWITLAVMALAVALLVRYVIGARGVYRRQAVVLMIGAAGFPAAVAVTVLEGDPLGTLELPVVAFVLPALAAAYSVARDGVFTLVPIARQAAVEGMDDAVVVVDVRGLVVDVNDAAEQFLTTDPRDAVGAPVGTTLAPVAVPPSPTTDGSGSVSEVVTDPESGSHYRRIATPLTGSGDVLLGQLVVVRDITERRRREERLRRQNEQLEEFAGVVSHDLRNPLNVITGRLQLARDTGDPEHFESIERATDRMDRLIDDLLELARQGRTVDEVEEVPIATLAREAWRTVAAPGSELEVSADLTVEGDPDRLRQIFENLFRNAVEHGSTNPRQAGDAVEHGSTSLADGTGNGEGGVSIRVEGIDDGFAVEDDGPGIPEEEREAVFEYGHTTAEDGTGFGLSIVREVVEAHGWTVGVTEGSAGGARFEITDLAAGSEDVAVGAREGIDG